MNAEESGLVPYHPRRRHHRPRLGAEWIFTLLCGISAIAGLVVGMSQREPRPIALVCHAPPPTMQVSTAGPVAMLCTGEVSR